MMSFTQFKKGVEENEFGTMEKPDKEYLKSFEANPIKFLKI